MLQNCWLFGDGLFLFLTYLGYLYKQTHLIFEIGVARVRRSSTPERTHPSVRNPRHAPPAMFEIHFARLGHTRRDLEDWWALSCCIEHVWSSTPPLTNMEVDGIRWALGRAFCSMNRRFSTSMIVNGSVL